MEDSMDRVMADVEAVFGFERDSRPQDRAHAYLENRQVQRGYNDTALQRVAQDLADRAFALGHASATGAPAEGAAALMTRMSGELLEAALALRGWEASSR